MDSSPLPEARQFHRVHNLQARASKTPPTPAAELAKPLAGGRSAERRRRRRALISAPVRIRSIDVTEEGPDEISSTIDVSRNGILFLTSNQAFHRGMEVAVTFPYTKAPDVVQAEQPGTVVRVSDISGGRRAVAIAFGVGFGEDLVDASGHKLDAATLGEKLAAGTDPKGPLILMVESDDSVRFATKAYLCCQGYEVIAVNSANDAREVLNMLTPVLLIAEIEGEGLPGFDLCAHVKATPRLKHIPVMLTTSSAYPSDYSNAHSLGAVVCMAKPYRQERLGHVVCLLAPQPGAREQTEPPRPADPTRRHKRLRSTRSVR